MPRSVRLHDMNTLMWLVSAFAAVLIALAVSCSKEPEADKERLLTESTPSPTLTAEASVESLRAAATPTATLTILPSPAATSVPTGTFTPTHMPEPTATFTPKPTTAPTAVPASTPAPTVTSAPVPTSTPAPAYTPEPTSTATHTPEPTVLPTPTNTPAPTATATPIPTATAHHTSEPEDTGSVEMDRTTLVALYSATDGSNWATSTNWLSDRPTGEWYGVNTGSDGRVTSLWLVDNQLNGSITPELSKLSALENLNFWGNNELSGEVPSSLGDLTSLRRLYLYGTRLRGEIPPELGRLANLVTLELGRNQLSGKIPSELGNLTSLTELSVAGNRLSGEVPSSLGNLTNLTGMWIRDNELSGMLPQDLTRLTQLESFFFEGSRDLCAPTDEAFVMWLQGIANRRGNSCGGLAENRAVLVALYNATDGANWSDSTNWLSERPLEEWYGVTADEDGRVFELGLGGNRLSGSIPPELGNLSNLRGLSLSGNDLSGSIPSELGNLSNLEWLALSAVYLTGSIPPELGRLHNLRELILDDNHLTGSIPPELGNLSKLELLNLGFNQLSGPVPYEFGNLSNLERLNLRANDLSGPVPSELGKLTNLARLELYANDLNGQIPSEIGRLYNLTDLRLGGNEFSGEVPPELGNLSNLTRLGLGDNEFSGEMPPELSRLSNLKDLDLGDNQLSGQIPPELGDLSSLRWLYLGSNQLSGCVPTVLRNVEDIYPDLLGLPFCDGSPAPAPRYSIETREREYGYTISAPDGWVEEWEGRYERPEIGGALSIRSQILSSETTLNQYSESVRDNLRQEWWPSASLFEITSFQKIQIGGQEFYSLQYRVQEGPRFCTLDVQERLYLGDSLAGNPHGFRVRIRFCEELALPGTLQLTLRTLDSFHITTKPASYYTQFLAVEGITVKASNRVRSVSMYNAAGVVETMMTSLREDIRECLVRTVAGLAITPLGEYITTVPEFTPQRGSVDFAAGVGAVKGQPVSGVNEDTLLGGSDAWLGATFHEFGHSVQNLCFTNDDHKEWNRLYREAQQANLFPGAYGMTNSDEFFAEFSMSYFEKPYVVQSHWSDDEELTRQKLSGDVPEIFSFLENVYPGFEVDPDADPTMSGTSYGYRVMIGDHGYAVDFESKRVRVGSAKGSP